MEELIFDDNFNKYSFIEKKEYLKELIKLFKLEDIIYTLILNNKDVEENFNLLESLSRTKLFKDKYNLSYLELNSLIINVYVRENKVKELNKYFSTLDSKKRDKIFKYEINNKTDFSNLKIIKIYNNDNNNKLKRIEIDKNKKIKATKIFLIIFLILTISYLFLGYCYSSIIYYNSHVYPNIYVDNMLIENMNHQELKELLQSKENILK